MPANVEQEAFIRGVRARQTTWLLCRVDDQELPSKMLKTDGGSQTSLQPFILAVVKCRELPRCGTSTYGSGSYDERFDLNLSHGAMVTHLCLRGYERTCT